MKLNIHTEPINDNKLVYNEKTKQYELTLEEVKEHFEISFNDDKVLEQRIKKNSRAVYLYIKTIGNPANDKLVKWFITYTEEGREYIYDALMSQIEADLTTGFNSIVDQPRINLKTGHIIPEDEFVKSIVSVGTMQILESSEAYVGINLLYRAKLPWVYWAIMRGGRNV
jgi:hypothetical protein